MEIMDLAAIGAKLVFNSLMHGNKEEMNEILS